MKIPALAPRSLGEVGRILTFSLLFTIYYLLFPISPVSAQTTNLNTTSNTNPNVPNNLHTWTQNVMIEVMAAATCQLAGVDPINPNQKCLGVDPKTNSIGFVPSTSSLQQSSGQAGQAGGAIGLMGNLIALTYTPPLHTGDYFSYLAQNFGLAKPAYAQGIGFQGLKPLMNLWIAFRNMVYLAFVVVFVIVGVAIMLRVKIDPRTVMTIENQIPKIIVGLLLVTFSFAIAGFLIDLMWVFIYLIFGIISGIPNVNLSGINPSTLQGKNPIEGVGGLTNIFGIANTMAFSVKDLIGKLLNLDTSFARSLDPFGIFNFIINPDSFSIANLLVDVISGVSAVAFGAHIATMSTIGIGPFTINGGAVTGIGAATAAYIGMENLLRFAIPYLIVFLVIFIAILTALIRLWFELIKAYIFILLDVVLAPFFVVLGLFPGSPIGFGAWLRDILANLSAFPVTIAMFLLGRVFIESFGAAQPGNQFVPPLIGNPSAIDTMKSLIGLGIILMTPQVVNMMKEMFKAPQFKYGAAIGQAVGVGTGAFNVPGHITKLGQFSYGLTALKGVKDFPVIGAIFGGAKNKQG